MSRGLGDVYKRQAEDMAKLGQLYLQRGKWNGQQLVSEYWIEISTARHLKTQNDTYGYGYQLWMEQRPGSFEYNGMLGQNVIIYPDMDMVSIGPDLEYPHSPDERVNIHSVQKIWEFITATLERI